MHAHPQPLRFGLLAVCALLSACGGSAAPNAPRPRLDIEARLLPVKEPVALDSHAAVSEILAAPAPTGLDPSRWRELTAVLVSAVEAGQEAKAASARPTGPDNAITDLAVVDDGLGGLRLEWTYVNAGDYDLNGEVNISDLTPVGMHFGDDDASADWNLARCADGDRNGEVNISDVTPLGLHYGAACDCYHIYGRNGDSGPYTYLDEVLLSEAQGSPPLGFSWPLAEPHYEHYMVAPCDPGGDDRPGVPIPSSASMVLEDSGLTLGEPNGATVLISGDTSALAPGQVLVGSLGRGFLGRVESITPQSGGALVGYSQATLEDLFDYAELSFSRPLTFDMLESFEPSVEGLKLTPSAMQGSLAPSSKQGDATLAAFRVEFPDKEFIYGLTLKGALEFKLEASLDFDVGEGWPSFGELQSFDFGTDAEVLGEVEVKYASKTTFANSAYLLGTLHFTPLVVFAGPIPLVFTPEVELYCGFEGTVEAGLMFKPFIKLSAGAGLRYTRDGGWDPYYDLDYDYSIGLTKPNLFGKIEVNGNIFSPRPTFELYGMAGPYAKFDLPLVKVEAQLQTTPPEFAITVSLGAKGSVGAKVAVLGRQLMDYESGTVFEALVKVFEAKWPLVQQPLTFDVEWESTYPGVPILRTDYHKPFFGIEKSGVGTWWLGYFEPGSLDEQPFALWSDETDYDAGNLATAGLFRFTVSKLEPGLYIVGLEAPILSHSALRVTKITVSGAASGSYEMENGAPPANNHWTGVTYDSVNDELHVVDQYYQLPPPY